MKQVHEWLDILESMEPNHPDRCDLEDNVMLRLIELEASNHEKKEVTIAYARASSLIKWLPSSYQMIYIDVLEEVKARRFYT